MNLNGEDEENMWLSQVAPPKNILITFQNDSIHRSNDSTEDHAKQSEGLEFGGYNLSEHAVSNNKENNDLTLTQGNRYALIQNCCRNILETEHAKLFHKLCQDFAVTLDNKMTEIMNVQDAAARIQDGPHIPVTSCGLRTNKQFKQSYENYHATSNRRKDTNTFLLLEKDNNSGIASCNIEDLPMERPKGRENPYSCISLTYTKFYCNDADFPEALKVGWRIFFPKLDLQSFRECM